MQMMFCATLKMFLEAIALIMCLFSSASIAKRWLNAFSALVARWRLRMRVVFNSEQSFFHPSIHFLSWLILHSGLWGYLTLPSYLRAKVRCTLNTLPDYRNVHVFGPWKEAGVSGEQPHRCREQQANPTQKGPKSK